MGKKTLLILLLTALNALGQVRNSASSTAQTADFSIPLNFDVLGHGVEMPPLEFEYDLESSGGQQLRLGELKIDTQNFSANLLPANRLSATLAKTMSPEDAEDWVFLFQWPERVMSQGELEAISRTGRVLWKVTIDDRRIENWQKQLETWRSALLQSRVSKEEVAKQPLFKIQFGLTNAERATPFWRLSEPFRFCFSHTEVNNNGLTRLCTSQYEILKNKIGPKLSLVPLAEAPPRVIIKNEDGKLADKVIVNLDQPFQFYAELRSGISYEFVSIPQKVRVVDMVQEKNSESAFVTIESDLPPLEETQLLNKNKNPQWIEIVGWEQTIGDFRKYWRTKISLKNPYLMVPGVGGGAFKQRFEIAKLPQEEARPYVHLNTIRGTYVDGAKIYGRKLPQIQVSSKQNSVEVDTDTKEDFTWKFGAKTKGDYNRSYLFVKNGENTFPAYHELYKGYAGEISSRVSGILGADEAGKVKLNIMGELALNYWFESILGWNNHLFSRQRWGTSLKAFRSINNLAISSRDAPISVYTADLKYRLRPGLWGRDETWGIIGGYQNVTYAEYNAQMAGVGVFWARSMPRIFDNMIDMIDWMEFLNHPKWVDFEFIYYPVPMNDTTVLGRAKLGNWALNFHGQIMFTKSFFGEAGFGLKLYDFGLPRLSSGRTPNFSFTSSYGTIGFGFKF